MEGLGQRPPTQQSRSMMWLFVTFAGAAASAGIRRHLWCGVLLHGAKDIRNRHTRNPRRDESATSFSLVLGQKPSIGIGRPLRWGVVDFVGAD